MAQQQLDLFDWQIDSDDDQFFVVEVLEETGDSFGYPLDALLSVFRTVYGYVVGFIIAFGVSAWLGMAFGDSTFLSPVQAMNSLVFLLILMLVVPVFWPILLIQIGCFFFPIRRGTIDAMVLSLVVLVMINLVAFGFMADMYGPGFWD